jgi:hypothetical protein
LQSYWKGLAHQFCLFHVIKEVNKLVLDGVRAIKNQIKRQGNKGRKRRQGRPSQKAQQHWQRRQGMSKKEQATFIYMSTPILKEVSFRWKNPTGGEWLHHGNGNRKVSQKDKTLRNALKIRETQISYKSNS